MTTKEELEKEEQEKKDRRRNIFLIIIFLFLLFLSSFGITYSMYKGDSGGNHEIVTDKIIFTYSDVDRGGNGIYIENALPIPDATGKKLAGSKEYFDFSINATSKKTNIKYQLLIRKNSVSTLSNNNVRVYLASLNGSYEHELVLEGFDELETTTIDGTKYYVLYEKVLTKGIENYSDFYRLRMWIKEDAINYDNKIFSINVDVNATQVGE